MGNEKLHACTEYLNLSYEKTAEAINKIKNILLLNHSIDININLYWVSDDTIHLFDSKQDIGFSLSGSGLMDVLHTDENKKAYYETIEKSLKSLYTEKGLKHV